MKKNLLLLGLAAVAAGANAQQIADRATLNSLLTSSSTDDFEKYDVAVGFADNLDTAVLDSNTVTNGQGPGLVLPGATYTDPSGVHLQWNGDQYVGMNSKTLLSNGTTGDIRMDYSGFVQAMGVDVKVFAGFGFDGQVDFFNGTQLLGTVKVSLAGLAGESVFAGWQNAAGITNVMVSSANYPWSPIIDDHTYGVVPEPATLSALGLGILALAKRRRNR